MALKKYAIFAVLILTALLSGYFALNRPAPFQHVFINETEDHRFDESIKVSILAAYRRTEVQNAVVISNLANENDLGKKAAETFQKLNLGRSNKGRAILYYFSPRSRSLKIEVGSALEGVLPDVTVKGLEMAAKSFTFVDRYQDFWAELINTLNIEIQKKEQKGGRENFDYDFTKFSFLSSGGGILSMTYTDSWQQLLKESRRTGDSSGGKYIAQSDVHTAIQLYLESLEQGFGDLEMDLLTKESQFFRKITPQSSYQMFRNARMYAEAGIDRIFVEDNWAFAFMRPEHPVLPLILQRTEGKWRIHEPLSWNLFQRFEDSNRVFLKFPIQGLSPELMKYLNTKLGTRFSNSKMP